MAKFIQSEVAGGVILAGKRTGQTAAWAGIDSLQVLFQTMLILLRLGLSLCFVTGETLNLPKPSALRLKNPMTSPASQLPNQIISTFKYF
jgi:hypothetical protein